MFLEERVEQLEHLAADQGRQTEMLANGLATLTVEVRSIRQDMTTGFERIDRRFEQIEQRLDQMDRRFDQMDRRFDQIEQRLDEIGQTQALILKFLTQQK